MGSVSDVSMHSQLPGCDVPECEASSGSSQHADVSGEQRAQTSSDPNILDPHARARDADEVNVADNSEIGGQAGHPSYCIEGAAAMHGNSTRVGVQLQAGRRDLPPLHRAIREGSLDLVRKLCDEDRVDIDEAIAGVTPIALAAQLHHFDIVQHLCESGAGRGQATQATRMLLRKAAGHYEGGCISRCSAEVFQKMQKKSAQMCKCRSKASVLQPEPKLVPRLAGKLEQAEYAGGRIARDGKTYSWPEFRRWYGCNSRDLWKCSRRAEEVCKPSGPRRGFIAVRGSLRDQAKPIPTVQATSLCHATDQSTPTVCRIGEKEVAVMETAQKELMDTDIVEIQTVIPRRQDAPPCNALQVDARSPRAAKLGAEHTEASVHGPQETIANCDAGRPSPVASIERLNLDGLAECASVSGLTSIALRALAEHVCEHSPSMSLATSFEGEGYVIGEADAVLKFRSEDDGLDERAAEDAECIVGGMVHELNGGKLGPFRGGVGVSHCANFVADYAKLWESSSELDGVVHEVPSRDLLPCAGKSSSSSSSLSSNEDVFLSEKEHRPRQLFCLNLHSAKARVFKSERASHELQQDPASHPGQSFGNLFCDRQACSEGEISEESVGSATSSSTAPSVSSRKRAYLEKRYASDRSLYTRQQFLLHFGVTMGEHHWQHAARENRFCKKNNVLELFRRQRLNVH